MEFYGGLVHSFGSVIQQTIFFDSGYIAPDSGADEQEMDSESESLTTLTPGFIKWKDFRFK